MVRSWWRKRQPPSRAAKGPSRAAPAVVVAAAGLLVDFGDGADEEEKRDFVVVEIDCESVSGVAVVVVVVVARNLVSSESESRISGQTIWKDGNKIEYYISICIMTTLI